MHVTRDASTSAFFDATSRGVFPLSRCIACDSMNGPQEQACVTCGGNSLETTVACGRARVVSWVVVHRRDAAGGIEQLTVVIGELEEGPWWWGTLVSQEATSLSEGAPLAITFVESGTEMLPAYRLVA